MSNNPVRFTDPTGHREAEDDVYEHDGNSGGDGGGDDCDDGDNCTSITTEDIICEVINCPVASTALALVGTGYDLIALGINFPFGVAATASLITALLGDPAGLLAYAAVLKVYQFVSPVSTAFGWAGFGAWALQGLVTGENQLGLNFTTTSDGKLKQIGISGSIAQDTIVSGLNDAASLVIKEPIVATIWSGVGVAYDISRNPLQPSSPILQTAIQPNGNMSYNFQTNSLSLNFSWFPP